MFRQYRLQNIANILTKKSQGTTAINQTQCYMPLDQKLLNVNVQVCHTKRLSTNSRESLKVLVNNIDFHYEKAGSGDHAVLLLPGALGSSQTDFGPQLEKMNKSKFTVIAFDPRGYGKTIPPERDFPLNFLHRDADDAAALMKKLMIDRFSVLGWSDGGITGMILAARCPDRVSRLVIWGSNAYITPQDMELVRGVENTTQWSKRMRDPFIKVYGEDYFATQWRNWVSAYQAIYTKCGGDICKDELRNIVCPTFILHGDRDPMLAPEHVGDLHKNIKNSRLHRFPDGKHNIHLRYADEFNNLVEDFLSE